MPTVPAMAVYISALSYDRERIQDPTFVGKMQIRERYYNEETMEYENRQGNAFSIERLMPVPYMLELKLDIWTFDTDVYGYKQFTSDNADEIMEYDCQGGGGTRAASPRGVKGGVKPASTRSSLGRARGAPHPARAPREAPRAAARPPSRETRGGSAEP